jgi:hypothetical protein
MSPVEWRIFSQLFFGLRQIADDKSASNFPKFFIFLKAAVFLQPFRHYATCGWRDIDAYPLALQILRSDQGGAAATKRIKNNIVLVAACFNDSL